MLNKYLIILMASMLNVLLYANPAQKIELSGEWKIELDSLNVGIAEKWFNHEFSGTIIFPGTLCDAGYGDQCKLEPVMERDVFLNLKRKYDYVGVAWYSKKVTIPKEWVNKDVLLTLERVIWKSQLWVDGKKVEQSNESLTTPHQFELTGFLSPGEHTLVIRIDNRKQHDITWREMGHAYTNETQTMWNGVIGELELNAVDRVAIENMALYPDVDNSKVNVRLKTTNTSGKQQKGEISFCVSEKNGGTLPIKKINFTAGDEVSFDYYIENPKLWDEFSPELYEAVAELKCGKYRDTEISDFGMRKLTNQNSQLQINGRNIFLRGTLECCVFPLKGYPPTDEKSWRKVFSTTQSYGLNHIRFHSWCPPEAAFKVADEMGIYLQIELPCWVYTIGNEQATTDFLYSEAEKILQEYGNHPSFCFWSMGNELDGDYKILDHLMMSLKKQDSRHLYTTTSMSFQKGHYGWPEINDDYWIGQQTLKGWVRGQGIFDSQTPRFDEDYSKSIEGFPAPIVTHEVGQYSVFPNLEEINKYTGNLIPLNFMAVRDDLMRKGRLDEAGQYTKSSGKLACLLYKEEIERALKTPGYSGFQLLDLHDFPGQGTALVGILDAFWESKGLITPEEFRSFCSPVVPLVRFGKATYTNNEIFIAKVEIANFSNRELKKVIPVWTLSNSKGQIVANGTLREQDIPIGNAISLGEVNTSLSEIRQAEKLTLSISLKDTEYRNSWEIWVYPKTLNFHIDNIEYTQDFEEAHKSLLLGKKVLLNPAKKDIHGVAGKFVQVFWSPIHFPNQPGTMGVLCDPTHPVFTHFPTEMYTNWQWWDICKNAVVMDMDSIDSNIQPLVRMVDNFFKNRNLGLIFEAKIGEGQLLVCSSDLGSDMENRPVANQLLYSLYQYMSSDRFNPKQHLSFDQIKSAIYKTESINVNQ